MKKEQTKTKKIRRKISFGGYILIASLIIVVIAGSIFAWLILDSSIGSGKTIVGNRFQLELNPKIETTQIEAIKSELAAMPTTVASSVNLKSATLRISVQVQADVTDEVFQTTILGIKDLVDTKLPILTYFTSTPDVKMYDLEIHVFNSTTGVSTETFTYHYFILVKNAKMTSWAIQEVSTPANPELAAELRASLNPIDDSTNTPSE